MILRDQHGEVTALIGDEFEFTPPGQQPARFEIVCRTEQFPQQALWVRLIEGCFGYEGSAYERGACIPMAEDLVCGLIRAEHLPRPQPVRDAPRQQAQPRCGPKSKAREEDKQQTTDSLFG